MVKKLNKYVYIYLFTYRPYEEAVFVIPGSTKAKFVIFIKYYIATWF